MYHHTGSAGHFRKVFLIASITTVMALPSRRVPLRMRPPPSWPRWDVRALLLLSMLIARRPLGFARLSISALSMRAEHAQRVREVLLRT